MNAGQIVQDCPKKASRPMKLRRRDFLWRRRLRNRFAHAVAALGSSGRQGRNPAAPRVVLTWGTTYGDGEFDVPDCDRGEPKR